jgi:hypothetical protein
MGKHYERISFSSAYGSIVLKELEVIILKLKILFPALVVLTLIGAGIIGVVSVKAQTSGASTTLVQMIADKFGLKTADVQAVFDQHRQNLQTDRQTRYIAFLDQAIKDGKLTAAQKQLLLTKHQDLQTNRQAKHDDLKTWATQNNIDLQYLLGGMSHRFGGMGRGMGKIMTPPTQ